MQTPQIQQMYRVCFTSAITLILVLLKVQENLSLQRNHFKWNQFSEKFSNLYMASPTFLQNSVMLFFILRKKIFFLKFLTYIFCCKSYFIEKGFRFNVHHIFDLATFIPHVSFNSLLSKFMKSCHPHSFFRPVANLITFLMDFGQENEK